MGKFSNLAYCVDNSILNIISKKTVLKEKTGV